MTDIKNILGLQLPTDPRWANLAAVSLEEILTDHAYCEQKAATSCISLIQYRLVMNTLWLFQNRKPTLCCWQVSV